MCQSMANIQSPTAEIRRGKKKKKKEERNRMKIYMVSLLHRATINKVIVRRLTKPKSRCYNTLRNIVNHAIYFTLFLFSDIRLIFHKVV